MKTADLLLTIPHASTFIPAAILRRIPHNDYTLLHEPDLHTERLYAVPGIDTVPAQVSRIIVDVNRAPGEVYTEGADRTKGVVMLNLSTGEPTFAHDPSLREMEEWINRYHAPFHEEVDRIVQEQQKRFLIDCHSMWSEAPSAHLDAGRKRPDICIGNCNYTACDPTTSQFIKEFWEDQGYEDVRINDPYSGRYITGMHCSVKGVPGVQIEINRSLYMNEGTLQPDEAAIARINGQFRHLVEALCAWDESRPRQASKHMVDLSAGHAGRNKRKKGDREKW